MGPNTGALEAPVTLVVSHNPVGAVVLVVIHAHVEEVLGAKDKVPAALELKMNQLLVP